MRARSATGDAEGECGARRASPSPSPSTETRATAETGGRFGRGVVRERRRRANADARAHATRADDDGRGAMTTTTNRFRDVFRVDDGAGGGDGGGGEDPPARFPASVALTNADGDAARDFRAMSAREWQETAKRMMRNQPTVLRRAGATGDETGVSATTATATARRADTFEGLTTMWSDFERTASRFGTKEWECLMCPSSEHKFVRCDDDKNATDSYFRVREPETEKMRCAFKDFARCATSWREKSILFDSEIYSMRHDEEDEEKETAGEETEAERFAPKTRRFDARLAREAVEDVQKGVDWKWLDSLLRAQRFGEITSMRLVAGQRDSLAPARYVLEDSMHLQVRGRRRVLLISPEHSFRGMYPYPVAHPYDGYSMVDFDDVNYGQTPAFSSVRGMCFVLEPGDVLYVPRGWWRHEQGLSKEHLTLEVYLSQGKHPRDRHAAALVVSRSIEERLAISEGVGHIKHWLQIIAEADDANWIDLSTVKGHKLIVMTQMVRDEIDLTLGRGSWQAFLRAMIDGRLDPTPWLNISFRDPLYLSDKPVQVPDTRTDLESQFPEFYVAKLKKEGYNVDYTPVSVFNPHHPETIASAPPTA